MLEKRQTERERQRESHKQKQKKMKKHQSEVLPPFSSNWTRRVVHLSTWPQLTSNGRWTTNDGRRATTVDISTAATMLSSFHQRPCLRSFTFLASIFFTIFTARAFWRLRFFLFFSLHFSFLFTISLLYCLLLCSLCKLGIIVS